MENEILRLNEILKSKLPNLSKINTYDGSKFISNITNIFRSVLLEKKFDIINFVLPANDNISYLLTFQICMDEILRNYGKMLNYASQEKFIDMLVLAKNIKIL